MEGEFCFKTVALFNKKATDTCYWKMAGFCQELIEKDSYAK